jgi:hypothetical protein
MTTVALFDVPALDVIPGDDARFGLIIRNDGDIVESYDLEVLGEAAGWATLEPAAVSLYPGGETRVTVTVRPPRSPRVRAGEMPFAVRVQPTRSAGAAAVPEGVLRVLPFAATAADVLPRTSKGRGSGRHEVAVDNRGNVPVRVTLVGADPEGALTLSARPDMVTVAPGEAVFSTVRARPRRRLWRGHPISHPFRVEVIPEDEPQLTVDATYVQTPVIPRGTARVLAGLLALLLLAAGVWFGLLKPAVNSAAKEAAKAAVAPPGGGAGAVAAPGGQSGPTATPEPGPAPVAPSAGPSATPSPAAVGPGGPVFSHSFQVLRNQGPGFTTATPLTARAGTTMVITDLFLQNPQGDSGLLEVLVDGTVNWRVSLQFFRDLDYHMISPIEVSTGRTITLRVRCTDAGDAAPGFPAGSSTCRTFVLVTGYLKPTPRA